MRKRSGWGAPPNGHLGIGTVFPRSCVFHPGQHWPNESPERGLSVSAYHVGAGLPACSMWWSFGSWCHSLVVISSSSLGWTEVSSRGRQRKYCHHCSVMFRVRTPTQVPVISHGLPAVLRLQVLPAWLCYCISPEWVLCSPDPRLAQSTLKS